MPGQIRAAPTASQPGIGEQVQRRDDQRQERPRKRGHGDEREPGDHHGRE
jgi:hypothetical protein